MSDLWVCTIRNKGESEYYETVVDKTYAERYFDVMFSSGGTIRKRAYRTEAEQQKRKEVMSKYAPKHESVDHPEHYNLPGSIECIDEMVHVFGRKAVMVFCVLNVWKYRYRSTGKNGQQDLEKANWYMRKFIELKGMKKSDT